MIIVIQDIDTNWRRTDRPRGSARAVIHLAGGQRRIRSDRVGLFAHDIDDDLVHTLIDAGYSTFPKIM